MNGQGNAISIALGRLLRFTQSDRSVAPELAAFRAARRETPCVFAFRTDPSRMVRTLHSASPHGTSLGFSRGSGRQASCPASTFLAVVHPNVSGPLGVDPHELTHALGGLFVSNGSSTLLGMPTTYARWSKQRACMSS